MIHHLFRGRAEHHIPTMIEYFMAIGDQLRPPASEHTFAFYDATPAQLERYSSGLARSCPVMAVAKGRVALFRFIRRMRPDDSLILHSAFYPWIWLLLLAYPRRWKNTSWIMWGADIYGRQTWRGRVYRWIKGIVVARLGAVSALVPGDFEDLQRLIGPCSNYVRAFYAPLYPMPPGETTPQNQPASNQVTRLVLGNSAWEQNDHAPVLEWLSRFKDRPIEVICPLGYPKESAYKSAVIAVGCRVLGDRFRPIPELLDWEEYHALLRTCNVLVLNSRNQQGLGAIYYMLLRGGKIYVRGDCAIYHMLKEFGFHVGDTRTIQDLSYEELTQFSTTQAEHNRELFDKHLSTEASIAAWNIVLQRIGAAPTAAPPPEQRTGMNMAHQRPSETAIEANQ